VHHTERVAAGERRGASTAARLAWLALAAASAACDAAQAGHGAAGAPASTPAIAAEGPAAEPRIEGWDFVLTFIDSSRTELARVYLPSFAQGAFDPATEYWSVDRDAISLLGRFELQISRTAYPEGAAHGAPAYARPQRFTLPKNVPWGAGWTRDPVQSGFLYGGQDGQYLRLKPGDGARPRLEEITWYQVLAGDTLANITPDGRFSLVGSSVRVPAGSFGYSIHQEPSDEPQRRD
jgi:hypothetical protein